MAAPVPPLREDPRGERERRGALLVHWLCLPALLYTGSAAAFYLWVQPSAPLVAVNAAAFLAVGVNELAFLRHRRVVLAQNVFAGIGVSCLVPMFLTGGIGGAGVVWYFAYLIFAYVLLGPKHGTLWATVLPGVTVLAVLTGLATPPYSIVFLIDAAWGYALSMLLVYLLNRAYDTSQKRLEERNAELALAAHTKARLAAIVESANDAILMVDEDGIIRSWNAAAERTFGYAAAEAVGRPAAILVPEDRMASELPFVARIAMGERVEHLDSARIRKDGVRIDVVLSVSPVRDAEGRVIAAAMVIRDVTQQKRAEEQAKEIERLKATDELKNALLSTVSHELKTPLTPLKLQTQLLQSEATGPLNEKQRKSVGIMSRNLDRLTRLVQQTLDVARLQGGRLKLDLRPTPLKPIVVDAVEAFEESAKSGRVTVDVDVPDALAAQADGARLTQVVFNLVSNALKFTPAGGRVVIRAEESGNGQIMVTVADTGAGLAPEHMPALFLPFSRVEDAALAKKEGTGLGLYICRGIVEEHGGTIWCESPGPDRGAIFAFTLPRATLASPAQAAR